MGAESEGEFRKGAGINWSWTEYRWNTADMLLFLLVSGRPETPGDFTCLPLSESSS